MNSLLFSLKKGGMSEFYLLFKGMSRLKNNRIGHLKLAGFIYLVKVGKVINIDKRLIP